MSIPRLRARRLDRLHLLIEGHRRRLPALEARTARWSWLRLLGFLGAGGLALAGLLARGPGAALVGGAAGLLLFLLAVRGHLRLEAALKRRRARIELLAEQIARMQLDWPALPPARAEEPLPGHPVELDLDLVGPHGLHRLLDRCATEGGSRILRAWLGDGLPAPERWSERQAAVRELVDLCRFRDRLALEGRLMLADEQAYRAEHLMRFLEQPARSRSLARWAALLAGLSAISLTLASWHLTAEGRAWWLLPFGIYVLATLWLQPRLMPAFAVATGLGDGLAQLQAVLGLLERQRFDGRPRLASRCRPIQSLSHRPSQALSRLRRLIGGASIRGNVFVWLPLNALVPWDLVVAWRLAQVQEALARDLPRWLELWQELEALSSLANLAWLEPDYGFAERVDPASGGPLLEAERLGHPLLPAGSKVANDLRVDQLGEIHLVTGSNMAGKSTWLRTVGLNLCLAFAGGPVDAARLRTVPLRLFGCTRVSDSVTDGISYFYAEVRRLRQLLDALEDPDPRPLAWFVDEIFRGTNNRERLIGGRAMVRALAAGRGFGLISTHDLELAALSEEIPGLRNAHFREQVEGARMAFDYRLRPGPCPTTNALRLMARAGLPVDPETPR